MKNINARDIQSFEFRSLIKNMMSHSEKTIRDGLVNNRSVDVAVQRLSEEIVQDHANGERSVDMQSSAWKTARKEVLNEVVDSVIDAGEMATNKRAGRNRRLIRAFILKAVPMGVFGFIDNLLMVIAGEYIDRTVAHEMGIGTMAAAGIGNATSDAVGTLGQDSVEKVLKKIGLGPGTESQEPDRAEKMSATAGGIFGVVVGCLIGMFPLAFMGSESDRSQEMDNQKVAAELLKVAKTIVGVDTIYNVTDDTKVHEKYWLEIQSAVEMSINEEEEIQRKIEDIKKGMMAKRERNLKRIARQFGLSYKAVKDDYDVEMESTTD